MGKTLIDSTNNNMPQSSDPAVSKELSKSPRRATNKTTPSSARTSRKKTVEKPTTTTTTTTTTTNSERISNGRSKSTDRRRIGGSSSSSGGGGGGTIRKTSSSNSGRKQAASSSSSSTNNRQKKTEPTKPKQQPNMTQMIRGIIDSQHGNDDDSSSSSNSSDSSDSEDSTISASSQKSNGNSSKNAPDDDQDITALTKSYPATANPEQTQPPPPPPEEDEESVEDPYSKGPNNKTKTKVVASAQRQVISLAAMARLDDSSSDSDDDDDDGKSFHSENDSLVGVDDETIQSTLSPKLDKSSNHRKIKFIPKYKQQQQLQQQRKRELSPTRNNNIIVTQSEHSTASTKASVSTADTHTTAGFQVMQTSGNISTWEMRQKFRKEFPNEPVPSDEILRQLYRTEKIAEYERQERFKLENPGEPVPSDFVLKKLYNVKDDGATTSSEPPPPPPPPPPDTMPSPALTLGSELPPPTIRRELLTRQDSELSFATEGDWEDYKTPGKRIHENNKNKHLVSGNSNRLSVFEEGNEEEEEEDLKFDAVRFATQSLHDPRGKKSSNAFKTARSAELNNGRNSGMSSSSNNSSSISALEEFNKSFSSAHNFDLNGGRDSIGFDAFPTTTAGAINDEDKIFTSSINLLEIPSDHIMEAKKQLSDERAFQDTTKGLLEVVSNHIAREEGPEAAAAFQESFHGSFGSLDSFGNSKNKKTNADWAADFVVEGAENQNQQQAATKKKSSKSSKTEKKSKKSTKESTKESTRESKSSRGRSSKSNEKEGSKSKSSDRNENRSSSRDKSSDQLGSSSPRAQQRAKKKDSSTRGRRTTDTDENNGSSNRSSHNRSKHREKQTKKSPKDLGSHMEEGKVEGSGRHSRRTADADDQSHDTYGSSDRGRGPGRSRAKSRDKPVRKGSKDLGNLIDKDRAENSTRRGRRTADSDERSLDMSAVSGHSRHRRRNSKGNMGENSFHDDGFSSHGSAEFQKLGSHSFPSEPSRKVSRSKSDGGDFAFGVFEDPEPSFPAFEHGERFFVESKSSGWGNEPITTTQSKGRLAPSRREVQRSHTADKIREMASPGVQRRMVKSPGPGSGPNTPSGPPKVSISNFLTPSGPPKDKISGFGTPTSGRPAMVGLSTAATRSRAKGTATSASTWLAEVPGVLVQQAQRQEQNELSLELELGGGGSDTDCISPLTAATRKVISRPVIGRRRGGLR